MADATLKTNPQFWDKIAEKYSKTPVPSEAVYQKKLKINRELLTPDMTVLEFGCGTGSTAVELAPHVKHYQANDVSNAMLDIGRQKARDAGIENISFEQGDIQSLDLPDAHYDAVMGYSILHLLPNRDEVIADVFRILKPGAPFVSSTACLTGGLRLLMPALTFGRWIGRLPYVTSFSEQDLVRTFEAAGFEIETHWRPKKSPAVFIVARKPG